MAIPVRLPSDKPKRGRYGVAKVEARTVDGIVFDSAMEASVFATLKLRQRIGEISELEPQHELKAFIGTALLCSLTVDFKYFDHAKARYVLEEVKSDGTAKDPYYKLRRKAIELYHGVKIEEIVL
jgi:hypothetical protein